MACKTLNISGLDLNIIREQDGSYNFQPLLDAAKNREISKFIKPTELPFFFSLNNISITDGKITFNDKPTGKIHTAEKIKFDLPTFSNTSYKTEQYLRPHFSAVVNGSPIELTGQTNLGQAGEEKTTRLAVDVHDLELPVYASYLPFSLPMQCSKGTANGKIDLSFDPQTTAGDKLSIGFQLQIAGAELTGENASTNISMPSVRVSGSLQPMSRTLHLSEVAMREPTINFFGGSFLEGQTTPVEVTKDKAAPYRLTLDQLLLDDGTARFFSDKHGQQLISTWNTVQASIKGYRSDAETVPNGKSGSFRISGEKEGTQTSFSWQGKFSSPDSLTGNLHLLKIDGKSLLKAIADNQPFAIKDVQGIADLKGQLIFYPKKESPNCIYYKLVDAEISVDDFVLLDNDQSILRAPVIKLTGFNLVDEAIDFGNIQLHHGTAQFIVGRLPQIYREFTKRKYRLQGLDFAGKVHFSPRKKSEQSLIFTEVSLKANELGNDQTTIDNLSVSAKTDAGAIFKVQGNVTLTPFSVNLKTGFRQLPVQDIQPFFASSAMPADLHGNLSGKGILSLPAKSFVGELELGDVSGKGPQETPFYWKKSLFRNVNYTAKPFHFGIDSVAIDGAHVSWRITRESNSPMQYFANFMQEYFPAADKHSSTTTESSASPVDIAEISFTASTIDIDDHRLSPDWIAKGVTFAGSINNIHAAAAAESAFSFTGQLADSPFTINGTVAPFAGNDNGTFHFSLETFPLASFANQITTKSEIDTSRSRLNLALDCIWQDQQYISSGKLVLTDLKPAAASSDIALPLALLSDSSGTIQLPFNFSRTAPVAKTALVEELFTSMQRMLLKGTVSPLLLASGDFTDLIGNEFIEFRPGEFILPETSQKTLSRYAALLLAHPNVGLVLSGGVDKKIDGEAMKNNIIRVEEQRVAKENERLFRQWQDRKDLYQKDLEERQKSSGPNEKIVEQDIPAEILIDFKPLRPVSVVVDEAMLLELAHKRIDVLYQNLITQLAVQPERISSVFPDKLVDDPENPAEGVAITLTALNQ